jgi:hypothetical protein
MANLVKTGLGGSRIKKESEKREGFYWDPPLWIPGEGITFEYVDINTAEDLATASHDAEGRILYPQASQTITGLQVTTSGYTGEITLASGTYNVVNGLIVGPA